MSKELQGKITICGYSSTSGGGISIELNDALSGTMLFRVEISHEEFGKAITSLAYRPCRYELGARFDLIGKKYETKHVQIVYKLPTVYSKTEQVAAEPKIQAEIAELLAADIADNWEVSWSNLWNHHYYSDGRLRLVLHRFVNPD